MINFLLILGLLELQPSLVISSGIISEEQYAYRYLFTHKIREADLLYH